MLAKSTLAVITIGLAMTMACGVSNAPPPSIKGDITMVAQLNSKIHFREYLGNIGDKLNCYFTIERLEDTEDTTSPLSISWISPDEVETIDALISKLTKELIGVSAARDEVNPSIIHLTENALLNANGYDSNQPVSLKYQGDSYHMLVELNKSIITVGPRLTRVTSDYPEDYSTQFQVDVQNMPLRQFLTSAVPLAGYERILWDASFSNQDGKPYTEIFFSGQK